MPNSPTKCSAVTNEECNYVCEPGYLKMGAHVCQANGRFAGGACNPAICSDGNTLPNSRTTCRGRVGDVCSYLCNPGFQPGEAHVCTPDPTDPAKASFVGGSCGQVTCSEGLTIENSITTCGGLAGDVCFYLCEMGFQPTGPHICGMDGWFRGGGCADVNGCADHVCASGDDTEATCLDLPPPSQGFECQCTAGYEQSPTGVCENIDECFGNTCQSADDFGAVCVDAAPGEQATAGGYSCRCSEGFTDVMGVCTAMDACTGLKPCENDGECVNILGDYYCNCPNGYGGENCEVEIDGCVNLPCKHNGACTSGAPGEFTCDCQGTGYEGPTCDVNTDDCAAAPCENSGTCVDSVERYTCQCISSAGFSGINCAEPVEPCSFSDRRKCSANAECYMQNGAPVCTCFEGYETTNDGLTCTNIDNCRTSGVDYCRNGGVCTDYTTFAECDCPMNWAGSRCELAIDLCAGLPCTHGGVCSDDRGAGLRVLELVLVLVLYTLPQLDFWSWNF